ncbi:MAG: hypothetical protein ACYSWP_18825 [Planctomycetota bacterium]|jgi:hypothetical protein
MIILAVILLVVPCLFCVGMAGYLCAKGKWGWGWFLFVGLLLASIAGQVVIEGGTGEEPPEFIKVELGNP